MGSIICKFQKSTQTNHRFVDLCPIFLGFLGGFLLSKALTAAKSLQSRPTLCNPHRQQPTRLPRPWDSPGKNTGVGCHFLLQCMKVKSESEVAQLCLTLRDPMDCSLPGSSIHGIFQARVLEWVAIGFSKALTGWSLFYFRSNSNTIQTTHYL